MNEAAPDAVVRDYWVLQAQLTEGGGWETLHGFSSLGRDELQRIYDKHFARIDGQGCRYRFAHVTVTERTEISMPG